MFGIIQNHIFSNKLTSAFSGQALTGMDLSDPSVILTSETRNAIPVEVLDKMQEALTISVAHTFAWAIIPAAIALIMAFAMGREQFDPASEMETYNHDASH
ncbi:hypothetical protein [Lysinibacillus sp. Bpr_S20]|uniref:hypothetical protein n=1 Tax=Lysinibacillus sp. Bpr_S20 TaxID=2933964 RepID=UPI002012B891|nr:hypothetical protein [Lysinibacillus sp. Bpr_S20]MCL1699097.1 hypothetical protein [Lysinibacillus sp. Bpr_S20]